MADFLARDCAGSAVALMFGGVILVLLYLVSLFAGFVAPYHYERQDRDRFFHPPTGYDLQGFALAVPHYEQLPGDFEISSVKGRTT